MLGISKVVSSAAKMEVMMADQTVVYWVVRTVYCLVVWKVDLKVSKGVERKVCCLVDQMGGKKGYR